MWRAPYFLFAHLFLLKKIHANREFFLFLRILTMIAFVSPSPVQLNNPDQRVVILRDFALANFPATPLMSYALEVEKITTAKVRRAEMK